MEFDKLINIFTVSAILIMVLTSFFSAGVAVKERAEMNIGYTNFASVSQNHTINDLSF